MRNCIKLFFIASISALSIAAYASDTPSAPSNANSALPKTILIVDLNNSDKATFNSFLKGKNAAIVIQEPANSAKASNKITLQSEDLLTNVFNEYISANKNSTDRNRNGIIKSTDPLFSKLGLMVVDKRKDMNSAPTILPLSKFGIQEIVLDGRYVSLNPEERYKNLEYIAGTVVLADGSRRLIRDIVTNKG